MLVRVGRGEIGAPSHEHANESTSAVTLIVVAVVSPCHERGQPGLEVGELPGLRRLDDIVHVAAEEDTSTPTESQLGVDIVSDVVISTREARLGAKDSIGIESGAAPVRVLIDLWTEIHRQPF